MENIKLNVSLLRKKVPNLTTAAKDIGLRPATVSNLCTGKTPLGRAEVRTLVALATLAECSVDDLIIRGNESEMIETGIKVLDVFAPITKDGINGFVARADMGQLVLLAEILYRLKKHNYKTILLMPKHNRDELTEVKESSDVICTDTDSVFNEITSLKDEQKTVLAADRSTVLSGELYTLLEKLQMSNSKQITTLLVDPTGEVVDEIQTFGPLDTLWNFDAEMVARKLYPAVNPVSSTSVIVEGTYLDQKHLSLQQRAKKVLRRYRELRYLVEAFGYEKLKPVDIEIYKRGQRLEAYLTQPFFVAEPFTKKEGVSLPLVNTLNDVQRILDGEADHLNVEKLYNQSDLDHVLNK
ncbi:ATP synthase beta subunit C-terminal domain-containing protein [Bacillaceae bacterium W0354]